MQRILISFLSTILFNAAIAGVLSLIEKEIPFWIEMVYSQCIGLSVMTINMMIAIRFKSGLKRWLTLFLTLPLSVATGMTMASLLTGVGRWGDSYWLPTMVLGLFFSLIGALTFLLSERIEKEVQQRELVKSESERREVEANLKLLQAQIEPHFLFNTLANVGSLIDSDPVLAKQLLERLNDWLRVALVRARSERATLGDELDMLENYLQILKIRFGERLRWQIEVGPDARAIAFPPMLLQPLVENAVRHGIEPKVGGGEIRVHASITQDWMRLEVSDDGVGIQPRQGGGAGLANVRERLHVLFEGRGRLTLQNGEQGGTLAVMEFPIKVSA